jgi:hypothetical protein
MKEKKILHKYRFLFAVLFAVFILSFPNQAHSATLIANAEIAHGDWLHFSGDRVDDYNYPGRNNWMLQLSMGSTGETTGPRVEFNSTRLFSDLYAYPKSFISPSTYIWEYPDRPLTQDKGRVDIDAIEEGVIKNPGIIAVRKVNNPLLLNDDTILLMDFTLKFHKPIEPGINGVSVFLGSFPEDQELIQESLLWQNEVSGWTNNGNGWWNINPADITVDVNYNFQIQLLCSKIPEYCGTAIYHKPQAFVTMGQWNYFPEESGVSTLIVHPEGETASYQLNESVVWHRSASSNRQDIFIDTVSTSLYDSDPEVNSISIKYGDNFNGEGTYVGQSFLIDIEGDNIIAAEVTTPTGRTWPLEIEEGWIGWGQAENLTSDELTALGIVEGTYNFVFRGLLGKTITASVDLTFDAPTQIPQIITPNNWEEDVKLPLTISWLPVYDASINNIITWIDNGDEAEKDFEFETAVSPDRNECQIPGAFSYDHFKCGVAFVNQQANTLPSGIQWAMYNFRMQWLFFGSDTFLSDFDKDGDVDYYDLAILTDAWLSRNGDFNWNPVCDISEPQDNVVNWSDFAIFGQTWLANIE